MSDSPDLFEQQEVNRRRSRVLVIVFVWFFAWLGFGGDFILREASRDSHFQAFHTEYFFPWLTLLMLVVGIGVAWYASRTGARKVLWATGARQIVEAATPEEKQLLDVVGEMAVAAGLPPPRVYLLPDSAPNAFATGRDQASACIVVTDGLLKLCSRDELQAVVAHELGHVKNLDIQLMTMLAAMVGAVALMSDGMSRLMFGVGHDKDGRQKRDGEGLGVLFGVFLIGWIVAWLLAPLVTRLMALGVSRDREYLADAMSAQFTRNPIALANALGKIDADGETAASIKGGAAHLCIADPLGRPINGRRGFWAGLLGTHPPIEDRIARLQEMAHETEPAVA